MSLRVEIKSSRRNNKWKKNRAGERKKEAQPSDQQPPVYIEYTMCWRIRSISFFTYRFLSYGAMRSVCARQKSSFFHPSETRCRARCISSVRCRVLLCACASVCVMKLFAHCNAIVCRYSAFCLCTISRLCVRYANIHTLLICLCAQIVFEMLLMHEPCYVFIRPFIRWLL